MRNAYFREMFGRQAVFINAILAMFKGIASYPKLLLEVNIRKNMGPRYLNMSSVLTVLFLFGLWPVFLHQMDPFIRYTEGGHYPSHSGFWPRYITWYAFLALFIFQSFRRLQETITPAGMYNFDLFSYYSGDILPILFELPFLKKKPSVREIEILYEPALFLLIGLVLWMMDQPVGLLIIVSGLIYSLSNAHAYRKGDDFVYDKNDERLINENIEEIFILDDDYSTPHGLRMTITKPTANDLRYGIAKSLSGHENQETTVS